jgi:vesicle coat complex subunit
MMESLGDVLRAGLKDDDAFVRKTSVVGIYKLFYHEANLCEKEGLLDQLRDMLLDANSSVSPVSTSLFVREGS